MGVLGLRLDRSRKTVWDMLCVGDRFPRVPAFCWNDLMREEKTKKKTSQFSTSKTSGVRVVLILRVPQKGRVIPGLVKTVWPHWETKKISMGYAR